MYVHVERNCLWKGKTKKWRTTWRTKFIKFSLEAEIEGRLIPRDCELYEKQLNVLFNLLFLYSFPTGEHSTLNFAKCAVWARWGKPHNSHLLHKRKYCFLMTSSLSALAALDSVALPNKHWQQIYTCLNESSQKGGQPYSDTFSYQPIWLKSSANQCA